MRPPISFKNKSLPGMPAAPLQTFVNDAPSRSKRSVPSQSRPDAQPSRSRHIQATEQTTRSRRKAAPTQEATSASNLALEVHRLREEVNEMRRSSEEKIAELQRVHREERGLDIGMMDRLEIRMSIREGLFRQILPRMDNQAEQAAVGDENREEDSGDKSGIENGSSANF